MAKIERKERIEGLTIAGIVNNGGYYYTDVEIYQDGRISAWEMEDLNSIKTRFGSPKLRMMTQLPTGAELSISGLGSYRIVDANWTHTPPSYCELIAEKVKQLNPQMANIYYYTEQELALWEQRRCVVFAKSSPFRVVQELFYETECGERSYFFMHKEGINHLVNVVVYKSGQIQVDCPHVNFLLTLDEFKQRAQRGEFFTELTEATEVHIGELGVLTFAADKDGYTELLSDKLEELDVIYEKLNGKDRLQRCRDVYYQYLENTSDYWREELRKAYLAVPESLRCYLGDMDSRDSDYVRILFTDEKREV